MFNFQRAVYLIFFDISYYRRKLFTVVIDVIIARGSTKVVSNFYHSHGITGDIFQYQKLSNEVKIELLIAVADSQDERRSIWYS